MTTIRLFTALLALACTTEWSSTAADAGGDATTAIAPEYSPLDTSEPSTEEAEGTSEEPEPQRPEQELQHQPDQPVLSFRVNQRPDLVQPVLDRWNAASCLSLAINHNGPHKILFTGDGFQHEKQLGRVTGSWRETTIRIRYEAPTGYNWITDRVRTVALTHEIAHVVARFNGHIDGSVLTGKHGLDPANDIITAELLTRVCRKHACQCFNPEGDVQPATDVVRTDGGIEDKEKVTLTDAGVQD